MSSNGLIVRLPTLSSCWIVTVGVPRCQKSGHAPIVWACRLRKGHECSKFAKEADSRTAGSHLNQ